MFSIAQRTSPNLIRFKLQHTKNQQNHIIPIGSNKCLIKWQIIYTNQPTENSSMLSVHNHKHSHDANQPHNPICLVESKNAHGRYNARSANRFCGALRLLQIDGAVLFTCGKHMFAAHVVNVHQLSLAMVEVDAVKISLFA